MTMFLLWIPSQVISVLATECWFLSTGIWQNPWNIGLSKYNYMTYILYHDLSLDWTFSNLNWNSVTHLQRARMQENTSESTDQTQGNSKSRTVMRRHTGERFNCSSCNKQFISKRRFQEHLSYCHGVSESMPPPTWVVPWQFFTSRH